MAKGTSDEPVGWRPVGTVVGNAGTSEFTFILRHFQARVGDATMFYEHQTGFAVQGVYKF